MHRRYIWPFATLLALALAACTFGPAPTPEPPTPTPRAREEQIARATEVAAQITATAIARAQPTNTPTPRPTVAPRPTLVAQQGDHQPIKATPIDWNAVPVGDGRRYRDANGLFAVTIPQEWEAYPVNEGNIVAYFVAPEDGGDLQTNLNVLIWDLPELYWVLPLSDITNEAMAEVREALHEDYTLVRLERIAKNGVQIDRLIGRGEAEDAYFVQTYMVSEHTLHVLTFFSAADQFEENMPIFDSILASYSPSGQ